MKGARPKSNLWRRPPFSPPPQSGGRRAPLTTSCQIFNFRPGRRKRRRQRILQRVIFFATTPPPFHGAKITMKAGLLACPRAPLHLMNRRPICHLFGGEGGRMSLLLPGLQQSLWAIEAAAAGLVTVSAAAVLQISAGTRWARGKGRLGKRVKNKNKMALLHSANPPPSVHPGRATTELGRPRVYHRNKLSTARSVPMPSPSSLYHHHYNT